MPPFILFLLRRLIAIFISLIIITMVLYAGVMMTPPSSRVMLFYHPGNQNLTEDQLAQALQVNIKKFHLDDPFIVQYLTWLKSLFQGAWGYSPVLHEDVLPALLRRTPATAELALFASLLFIPIGLVSGVVAGWNQRKAVDNSFRLAAFISTAFPPFILSIILIAIFYVSLHWFAPFRLNMGLEMSLETKGFVSYTGMYTIDGLLNHRLDVTWDALRHLVMPVITLSLFLWATVGRIIRAAIITERRKEYIMASRARGARENMIMWRQAVPNALTPAIASLALSAASLVTGVFVVEIIFSYAGISDLILKSMLGIPDPAAALGFAVYSVLIVLALMLVMDILIAVFDPRVRTEVLPT